jgi:hypothetical protein
MIESATTAVAVVWVLGLLFVSVAGGSVLVGAITDSADNTDSGNALVGLALLKSALLHLHKVEARLR